jgi:hypothetical protein
LPPTATGWNYGKRYLGLKQPLMRDVYYRLPPAALMLMKKLVALPLALPAASCSWQCTIP